MQTDTKHRLLNMSEALFAERGFYGVSIAAIAKEMGFSKQALLHHYPTKEKLYGAVLQRISDDFLEQQLEAECNQAVVSHALLLEYFQLKGHN